MCGAAFWRKNLFYSILQVRGFGDPLVATYMRAYLVHKMYEVAPQAASDLVLQPLWDTFTIFQKQLSPDGELVQLVRE